MFHADGKINGKPVHFLIDTGATLVSIGRSDAKRLKIDLARARPDYSQTANGVIKTLHVKLDSVSVGGIQLNDVEGAVRDSDHDISYVLLGMSFLQRMEMKREGDRMQLRKRF
jgi:aspartyl protease family protein